MALERCPKCNHKFHTKGDLFDHMEMLPREVRNILNRHGDEDPTSEILDNLNKDISVYGYAFDYDLGYTPFGLRRMPIEPVVLDGIAYHSFPQYGCFYGRSEEGK